ncbi:MAG: hypothetical protein SFU83_14240 [Meiothermus sp.]|nr:hypothetical protein [Meiothermus sp.]
MAEILERSPLTRSEAGDIFVEGSRALLEVLVDAYNTGASPEALSLDYP